MRHIVFILLLTLLFACSNNENTEYTGVLEGTVVRVPALIGGVIVNLFAEEGSEVQQDQLLAITDTTDLFLQTRQLNAQMEELSVQTEIAQTQLDKAEKDYRYIQEKYERTLILFRENSVPQQSLDDIENQLEQVATLRTTAKQQILSIKAREKQLTAQNDLLHKRIKDAKIIAPLAGVVSATYFEQGEAVPMMGALIEITSIAELETRIYVDGNMLPHINHGQTVKARIDGVDSAFTGTVSWISPQAEFTPKSILTPDTRTSLVYAVKVTLSNENNLLKHGMPVVITL